MCLRNVTRLADSTLVLQRKGSRRAHSVTRDSGDASQASSVDMTSASRATSPTPSPSSIHVRAAVSPHTLSYHRSSSNASIYRAM
eukprot:718129-Rhodomonas_salina.2